MMLKEERIGWSRGGRDATRYELPYASMNWIRFEGSPCCTSVLNGLSAP
jgi:hypothetical protein